MATTPEQQWNDLMVKVRDIAVRGFWLARRCRENNGFGESVFSNEQYLSASLLCDELTVFLKERVAAVKTETVPVSVPALNGKAASPVPQVRR